MNNKREVHKVSCEMRAVYWYDEMRVDYWDNGQLKKQSYYKNGEREGTWVGYHKNGQLSFKGNYKNNKREGTWVTYYKDGQLMEKSDYRNGEKVSKVSIEIKTYEDLRQYLNTLSTLFH